MTALLMYLSLGALAGLSAGLLGIGGGLIIVPALLLIWQQSGVDNPWLMQMAIATSLASIIFTSVASVRAHHRRGAVQWLQARQLAPGILLGAWLGAMQASWLPGQWLKVGFGIFELLVAAQMVFQLRPRPHRGLPGGPGMGAAGVVIGWVSALMGIGGGTLTVPFLSRCNVVIQKAVATSAACGLPIALAGSFTYVLIGWNAEGLPPAALGFVYLPALLGVVVASVLFAPLGARLAHSLSGPALKRVFALCLALLGLWMLLG